MQVSAHGPRFRAPLLLLPQLTAKTLRRKIDRLRLQHKTTPHRQASSPPGSTSHAQLITGLPLTRQQSHAEIWVSPRRPGSSHRSACLLGRRLLAPPSSQFLTHSSHQVKRVISKRDSRRRENASKADEKNPTKPKSAGGPSNELVREVPQLPSSLFFQHNEALVPPYNVLVDTNFLSHTVQRKLPLLESMMDLLYAKANPIITDCVMGELEKLGPKYRLALRIARDTRWERLKCDHKGIYADDCIVDRGKNHFVPVAPPNTHLTPRHKS
jgi:U3 small nucleolar RNA-associated protein 24